MPEMLDPGDLQGRAKICACAIGGWASMRRSLSLDWHPARKEPIAGCILPVTFHPTYSTDSLSLCLFLAIIQDKRSNLSLRQIASLNGCI
ncbi:MAG: hypothetical protein SOX40_04150 [Bacteroidaceae bacterium]|nr:hypothetical protein [Bacteroidaceae bacterium]